MHIIQHSTKIMDQDLLGLYPSDNDDIALHHLFTEPNINRATSNNARGDGTRDGGRERRRRRSKSKRDKSKIESSRREEKREDRRESSTRRRRRSSSRNTLDTKDTKGTLDTKGTTKSNRKSSKEVSAKKKKDRHRNTISDDDGRANNGKSKSNRDKSKTPRRRASIDHQHTLSKQKRRRRHTIDGEKLYQGRSKQRSNVPPTDTATKSIWDTSTPAGDNYQSAHQTYQTDDKSQKKKASTSIDMGNSTDDETAALRTKWNTLGSSKRDTKHNSKRDRRTRSRPKSRGCTNTDTSIDDEIGFISSNSRDELVKRQVTPWAAQQQGMPKKCNSKGSLTSLSSYERDNSNSKRGSLSRGGLRRVKSDRRMSGSDTDGDNSKLNRRGRLKPIKSERRMSGSDTDGGNNSSTDDLFANCLGSTFTNRRGSTTSNTDRLRLIKSTGTGWKERVDDNDDDNLEENERYPLPSSSSSRRPGLEQQISSRRQERLRLVKSTGTGWKERHDDNNEEDNLIQVMPRNGRPRLERQMSNSIGNSFSKSREESILEERKSAIMRSSRRRPLANSLDSQRRPMTCDQSITIEDLERGIKTPICQSFRHSYTRSNSTSSLRASGLLRDRKEVLLTLVVVIVILSMLPLNEDFS